jgi:hypothetical protein
LKPIFRRVWAPRGVQPVGDHRPKYQWLWLYGFVRPDTGEVFWLVMPSVDIETWSIALHEFAKDIGAGRDKRIALVLDGAGWHPDDALVVPEGIHLIFLPPYSPELQPSERLWPLVREAVANEAFPNVDVFEDRVCERCRELDTQGDLISGLTNFSWWREAVA